MPHLNIIPEPDRESFSDLCDTIQTNQVIPIIGFDLFGATLLDSAAPPIPNFQDKGILTMLASAYNHRKCSEIITQYGNKIHNGYDLINILYHSLERDKKLGFASAISNLIVKFHSQFDPVPDCFKQLARIKPFRFYINATFFNSLELAVSTYKVPKDPKGEKKNYDVFSYNPREMEVDIHYDNTRGFFSTRNFKQPTIYNLLGTHDRSGYEYVINDVHYTELLVKLIANTDKKFNTLKEALKDANLLFIGCDFPEWILRFFLRFCVDERLDKKDIMVKIIEQLPSGRGKSFLLGNYKIKKYNLKPDVFVNALFKELEIRGKRNNQQNYNIEEEYHNNLVFISYNHADKDVADTINEELKNNFVDSWYDKERLNEGKKFTPDISKAIDNACAVIFLVTNNSHANPGVEKYFKAEWNYAFGNYPEKACKVIISDYKSVTLPDPIFTDSVNSNILKDGEILLLKDEIDRVNPKLSNGFIQNLRKKQYEQRLSDNKK